MNDRRNANSKAPAQLGHIVVFDSDQALAGAIASYLEHLGFDASCLSSPEELASGKPDLAVLGGAPTDIDFGSLVKAVRDLTRGAAIPIVLMAEEALEDSLLRAEVDAVLVKPFQMQQLLRIVKSMGSGGSFARRDSERHTKPDLAVEPLSIPSKGKLKKVGFDEIFAQCWHAALTGSVTLSAGSTWRRIDLNNGFPVSARSNLVTEHLHRYLLKHGHISPETYRQLLPKTQGGQVETEVDLDQDGILHGIELDEARRRLVDEIIGQCFRWHQAEFRIETRDDSWVTDRFDINPFRTYQRWLLDPSESTHLRERTSGLLGKDLEPTPRLHEHAHLVADLLADLSASLAELAESIPAQRASKFIDEGPRALAALVTLADLDTIRPIAAQFAPPPRPQRPHTAGGGRKLKRLRQMVREDQARVSRAKNAYVVLGLTDGASNVEVRDTFSRLSRFYRAENFARLGDADLQRAANDLLTAFQLSATEILGEAPSSVPVSESTSVEPPVSTEDDRVLAEVFFDDGNTYLRIGALDEAQAHYARARALDGENTKYLSYHAWCTYQLGRDDPARAMAAKQALLAALKLDSKNDRALYFLGCLYEDTGREERAIECWKKALQANSGNFDARAALRRVGG